MRWLAGLAVALAACSGAQQDEGQTSAYESDVRAAIEACRSAQERVLVSPGADRQRLLAEGCASLFTLPLCSEAIRLSPEAEQALRPMMIIVACHRAYCPLFEEDGETPPALCGMRPASMSAQELMGPWSAFASAVLAHELGLTPGSSDLTLLVTSVTTMASPPQAELLRPGRALLVEVRRDGGGYEIAVSIYEGEAFGPWTLPLAPDVGDLTGLLEAAARELDEGPALIRASHDVEQAVVADLLEALRELGIEDASLETTPTR